jgi:hypothetical protein
MTEKDEKMETDNIPNSHDKSIRDNWNQHIDENNIHNNFWTPPKLHGLQNARQIIQPWFLMNRSFNKPIDYVEIIKDDIRNFRPLHDE